MMLLAYYLHTGYHWPTIPALMLLAAGVVEVFVEAFCLLEMRGE